MEEEFLLAFDDGSVLNRPQDDINDGHLLLVLQGLKDDERCATIEGVDKSDNEGQN